MNEYFKIILTSGLTVIGGVLVYIVGQIISKLFLDPINAQSKAIEDISETLVYYANTYSNPTVDINQFNINKDYQETRQALRKRASVLVARTNAVKCYSFFVKNNFVLSRNTINKVSEDLIGLSNNLHIYTHGKPESLQDAIAKNNGLVLEIRNLLGLPEMKDDENKKSNETISE
ncbi:MAG: hypothetical protein PHQ86_03905 [Dehalococcoidales bacterium]|nr:hypothetical protein [Dehalococcoidales bacterium]